MDQQLIEKIVGEVLGQLTKAEIEPKQVPVLPRKYNSNRCFCSSRPFVARTC